VDGAVDVGEAGDAASQDLDVRDERARGVDERGVGDERNLADVVEQGRVDAGGAGGEREMSGINGE